MLTTEEWSAYVAMVDELNAMADASVEQFVDAVDFSMLDTSIAEDLFTEYMYDVVARYGDAASELAVEIYTQTLERIGLTPNNPTTMTAELYEQYIRSYVEQVLGEIEYDESGQITDGARANLIEKLKDAVLDAINELKNDTMEENARRNAGAIEDYYKHWYAYIPNAGACPWCILIASNGWTETKKTESYEFSLLHDHCRCNVVIDYGTYSQVNDGYDFTPYKQLYKDSQVEGENMHRPYKTLWQMQKKLNNGALSNVNSVG